MKKIILLLLIISSFQALSAQRISHCFNNVTMPDALSTLERMTHRYTINFIYNDLEDFRVTTNIERQTVPEALRQIIGFYPITATMVNDSLISVECYQKAQTRYKGRIIDAEGQPIEFANVTLLTPKDSVFLAGGVSNESGYFTIPCESKSVIVRVSYVGYKTVAKTVSTPNIGNVRLQPDRFMLKGVTVKTLRPQYKMAHGGMTVDVEHSVLSKMGNGMDVLGQLPRVSVNGNAVEVFAKGTPLIYINNKKVTDYQELSQLKSEDIKNVDVITSPGAQYDATVKSVIRIRTKKAAWEGFGFTNTAKTDYNSMWDGYDWADLKYRTGGLEIQSNTGLYSQTFKENNDVNLTLMPKDNTINIYQKIKDNSRENILSQTVKLSYDFNADNSIGASYWYYKTLYNRVNIPVDNLSITRNGQDVGFVNQISNTDRYVGPRSEANVYYIGKLGKWSLDFNGSYVFMKYTQHMAVNEQSDELDNREVSVRGGQRSKMWAGKLVATYPIGKGELAFGSEYTHTKSEGFNINEPNLVSDSQTLLYEYNIAGFASFNMPFGHYQLNTGLRYEHVKTDYYSQGVWESEPSRKYDNVFPNISLSWNKDLWSWQVAYAMKTKRPSYRNLRNYMQYDNRYLYEGGNPYLRPEYIHNVELSGVYKWLSITAGYNYYDKKFSTRFGLYEGQEIAYMSVFNIGHMQSTYASIVASPKFGWYHPQYEIDYAQMFYHEPTSFKSNSPSFEFHVHNTFVLPSNWMLMLNFDGKTDWYEPMCSNKGYFKMSAMIRKSFFKDRLVFMLQGNDITRSVRERWTFHCPGVLNSKDSYNYTQSIGLTVTYKFNATRSRYKGTGAGNAEKKRL